MTHEPPGSRWERNYWRAPIGYFELVQNGSEFHLEDGEGCIHSELESTDRESAIREAEEWILRQCEETIGLLLRTADDVLLCNCDNLYCPKCGREVEPEGSHTYRCPQCEETRRPAESFENPDFYDDGVLLYSDVLSKPA